MHLLITRPQPDAGRLAETLTAQGHRVFVEPLMEIVYRDAPPAALDGAAALAFTSSNGVRAYVRAGGSPSLPVFAVGSRTAQTAREAGFSRVRSGPGDVTGLARLIARHWRPGAGLLLHPSGAEVAGDLASELAAAGFACRRVALYQAQVRTALSPGLIERLKGSNAQAPLDGVLLYSPRTAAAFARLIGQAGLATPCSQLAAYCLSAAVRDALGDLSFKRLIVAGEPSEAALLNMLQAAP